MLESFTSGPPIRHLHRLVFAQLSDQIGRSAATCRCKEEESSAGVGMGVVMGMLEWQRQSRWQ